MAEALPPVVGGVAGGLVVPLPQAAKNMAMKMLRAITKERFRNMVYSPSMCLLFGIRVVYLKSGLIRTPFPSLHSQQVTLSPHHVLLLDVHGVTSPPPPIDGRRMSSSC